MTDLAMSCGRSRADKEAAQRAATSMAQRGFVMAVADAARGVAAVEAAVRSGTAALQAVHAGGPMLMGTTAVGACQYALSVTQLALHRLETATGVGARRTPVSPFPAIIAQHVEAVADSQVLEAAAAIVLDRPNLTGAQGGTGDDAGAVCVRYWNATVMAAQAVVFTSILLNSLWESRSREGQRLAAVLLRATRHVAVRRLQVGLLDQLAAHAGMGAGLEGEEEAEGQGQQEDGWEGSSGTWWFVREEAERGQLVGHGKESLEERLGRLEDHHGHIVAASLGDWSWTMAQMAAEAGVPAGPPFLLAARLAARAAEALCRLCRGEGLGGGYGPAPEWEFAMAQVGLEERTDGFHERGDKGIPYVSGGTVLRVTSCLMKHALAIAQLGCTSLESKGVRRGAGCLCIARPKAAPLARLVS